jgi:hypothetical protein
VPWPCGACWGTSGGTTCRTPRTPGCDDQVGRDHGYVVFGDGLTLEVLRSLVRAHPDPTHAMAALPPALRDRLTEVVDSGQD